MEQLETLQIIFSKSHDNKMLVLTINGKTFKESFEMGMINIPVKDVIVPIDRSMSEFDRIISEQLSEDQRKLMYELFINSNQLGKGELRTMLGVNKETLEKIIARGIIMGVFRKIGSQVGPKDKETKDKLKMFIGNMLEEEPKEIVINPIDQMKEQMHLKQEGAESGRFENTKAVKELPKRKVKK